MCILNIIGVELKLKRSSVFAILGLIAVAGLSGTLAQAGERSPKDFQQALSDKGFNPGAIDGVWGEKSAKALGEFQKSNGLQQTGKLDSETIEALFPVGAETSTASEAPIDGAAAPSSTGEPVSPQVTTEPPVPALEFQMTPPLTPSNSKPKAILKVEPTQAPQNVDEDGGGLGGTILVLGAVYFLWRRFRKRNRQPASPKSALNFKNAARPELKTAAAGVVSRAYTGSNVHTKHFVDNYEVPHRQFLLGNDRSQPNFDHGEIKATWHPLEQRLAVGGHLIGGLIYSGKSQRQNPAYKHVINPALPVSQSILPFSQRAMDYWADYAEITPAARATYLAWHAEGRRASDADVGYMFLFFYGLEYRYFQGKPTAKDRADIIHEVIELLAVYGTKSWSVERYLGEFLDYAQIDSLGAGEIQPVFQKRGWELPLRVRLAIGQMIASSKTIPGDWMLSWTICHQDTHLQTPAKRCRDEFKILFLYEFNKRYPNGYAVRAPKRSLPLTYQSASGAFRLSVSDQFPNLPDISALTKPVADMKEIIAFATERLDKFSRFIGRNPESVSSLEAQLLLPKELRMSGGQKHLDALRVWAGQAIESRQKLSVSDLIERIERKKPSKISKAQLSKTADALEMVGIGIAPDLRFSIKSPQLNDRVILFDLGTEVEGREGITEGFREAFEEITLSAFVAHADGEVVESEKQRMIETIKCRTELTDIERRRLHANLLWLIAVPPDLNLVKQRIKESSQESLATLRSAVIATAKVDGIVKPSEVARIERVYAGLGLDQSLVYSDLHPSSSDNDPIVVARMKPQNLGEAIAEEQPLPKGGLNYDKIDQIRNDTAGVSKILSEIFNADESPADQNEIKPDLLVSGKHHLLGLDEAHTSLVRHLVGHSVWVLADYEAKAKSLSLFPDGALETINDWAFARYGALLLEAYGDVEVIEDVAGRIRDETGSDPTNG